MKKEKDITLPKSEVYERCLRCGRRLRGQKSKGLGLGLVCYRRAKKEPQQKHFIGLSNGKD